MARHAAQQALAIDPQYGQAYAFLAAIEMRYDWDFVLAFEHLQQALALSPGDAYILRRIAELNSILGRVDEAIDQYERSIAPDPVSYYGHSNLGWEYYKAYRLEEAADSIQLALSLNPSAMGGQYHLGLVLLAQGDAVAALLAIEQEPHDGYRLTGMAIVQHALGDAGASDTALQELIENWGAIGAYQVAEVYAFRGEIDYAFDWLEQAYDRRDEGLTWTLLDPLLTNLHDDRRWEPFLDKMGLPH
jgi:tetratricopeptide (TPR) repeat protein